MGVIKIYRYRIQPERVPQFLAIQRRADVLYREHVEYSVQHCRSRTDPWQWTEIHTYPNLEMLLKADSLTDHCAPLRDLFAEFLATLDPKDQAIGEEILEDHSIIREAAPLVDGSGMIDHVTIYVSDLERSREFYAKAFEPLGYRQAFGEAGIFWAFDIGHGALFEIAQTSEKSPLTPVHIAFRAKDHDQVKAFYSAALGAGAMDNGPPGPRPQYTANYFACFVHDPDGHNIEAVYDVYSTGTA